MNRDKYLTVSGAVFGLVSLLHITRLVFGVTVHVGTWIVPVWLSWAGFIGAGFLSAWAFRLVTKQAH